MPLTNENHLRSTALNTRLNCDIIHLNGAGLSSLTLLFNSTPSCPTCCRLCRLFLISLWYLQTLAPPNHNLCHRKSYPKIAGYLSLLEGRPWPHTTYNFKCRQQSSKLKTLLARCSCCPSAVVQGHLPVFYCHTPRAASRAASPVTGIRALGRLCLSVPCGWRLGAGLSLFGLSIFLAQ